MKRLFQQRFFNRKWVVPVAALVLTLSVGSIAFATTGTTSGGSTTSTTAKSATASDSATATIPATATTEAATAATGTDLAGTATESGSGGMLTADQLAAEQAKENAILDLLREKMTSADQVTFDQLRTAATEEQTALQQAQANLNDTMPRSTHSSTSIWASRPAPTPAPPAPTPAAPVPTPALRALTPAPRFRQWAPHPRIAPAQRTRPPVFPRRRR